MDSQVGSQTALITALMRAVHSACEPDPLFHDPFAPKLFNARDYAPLRDHLVRSLSEERRQAISAIADPWNALVAATKANRGYGNVVLRTRYADDALAEALNQGQQQVVLLGAGMDSLALRLANHASRVKVLELDHPTSQKFKQACLHRAGLATPDAVVSVPIDFEVEDISDTLARAKVDLQQPSLILWLGVTPYLFPQTNRGLIRALGANAAVGSRLIFNYLDVNYAPKTQLTDQQIEALKGQGEPIICSFDPPEVQKLLSQSGFTLVEDCDGETLRQRYGKAGDEDLKPTKSFRIVQARVGV